MVPLPKGYRAALRLTMVDAANRLAYLGYYGDSLIEFLEFILSKEGTNAYRDIVATSISAGYCPVVDRVDWAGSTLPNPDRLTGLPEALEHLAGRYESFSRSYPDAPSSSYFKD